MKDSLGFLRTYLAITGGLIGLVALMNIMAAAQAKDAAGAPAHMVPLAFAFSTLSMLGSFMLLISALLGDRLIVSAPRFIKVSILLNYVLMISILPFNQSFYLGVSLLLLWTGVSFFMLKMAGRLALQMKN